MRVLITNEHLDQRPGSDLFTRDLARCLQKRGHFVVAYSSDPRHQVRMLERDLIAVATDLARLPFRPDIIHARNHLDAMTALIALPDVPAIFDGLGGSGIGTIVPRHPRLHRYIVPGEDVAAGIAAAGLPAARIAASDFGVDLERFATVRSPSKRAERLAVYDDRFDRESPIIVALEAALGSGSLDLIGRRLGRAVDDPERRLPAYDVVFASGPRAVEAMACGCAVVVVDEGSCAGPVTMAELEAMRSVGFAPAGVGLPALPGAIRQCLDRFAADDAAAVTTAVRRTFSFDALVDRLIANYEAAIDAAHSGAVSWEGEQAAISGYLRELGSAIKSLDSEQRREGNIPLSTAMAFLDVAATLSAIQADLDRPQWWPSQRPPGRPADSQ